MRKLFTSAVVVLTIFWAVGLAAFVPTAQAVSLSSGDLIKASLPAVYYYGADAKRYVFPDQKTYETWYGTDFSSVKTITDEELAQISIGGNVTYRPGMKMIKINTDPKVYAVSKGGTLHWVSTEAVASCLYGSDWASMVNDVSDAFFVNYTIGDELTDCADYDKDDAMASAPTINVDKGLAEGGASGFSVSLAADNPAGATVPIAATSVKVLKFNISGSGTVNSLTFKAEGVGDTADIFAAYLYEGSERLTSGKTFNSITKEATFNVDLDLSTRVLTLVVDIDPAAVPADEHAFKLLALNGEAVGGVMGNKFTIGAQTVSTITLDPGPVPSNPQVGEKGAEIANFKLTGGTNDAVVNRITLTQVGSINADDLTNFVLKQAGNEVASVDAIAEGDRIVLVFTPPFSLLSGAVKTFTLYADIAGRPGRSIHTYLDEDTDLEVIDSLYGFGATVNNNFTSAQPDVAPLGVNNGEDGMQVTAEGGEVTISFNGPLAGDVSKGAQDAVLFEFAMTSVAPVMVKNTYLAINGVTGATPYVYGLGAPGVSPTPYFTDIKLKDADTGQVLAGPVSIPATQIGAATSGTLTMTDDWELDGTRDLVITADISRTEDNAGELFNNSYAVTLGAGGAIFNGGTDIKYQDSNDYVNGSDIVPNSPINGNQQTVLASSLSVATSTYLSDNTHVKGVQDAASVAFTLTAGSDSDVKVKKMIVDVDADTNGGDSDVDGNIYADVTGAPADALANTIVTSAKLWQITSDGWVELAGPQTVQGTLGAETVTFDNVDETIPAGESILVAVSFNASTAATTYPDQVLFQIKTQGNIEAYDKDDNLVTPTLITTAGQAHVNDYVGGAEVFSAIKASGNINVTADNTASDYKARLVQMGGTYKALRAKARSTDEDFKISDLRVSVQGNQPTNAVLIAITYPTDAAQTTFETKTSSITDIGGPLYVADFTGMNWYVKNDTDVYASLEVQVNNPTDATTGISNGFNLQLEVDNTDTGTTPRVSKLLGLSSGQYVTNGTAVDAAGNSLYARETIPTFDTTCDMYTGGVCPTTGATPGVDYWADLEISNTNGNQADIYALTLELVTSDNGSTDWVCALPPVTAGAPQIVIYDADDLSTPLVTTPGNVSLLPAPRSVCSGGAGADTAVWRVVLDTPLSIPVSDTKIFRVEVNSINAATGTNGDTFRVSAVSADTAATAVGTADIQWDDGSTGAANNNGFKLEVLPARGPSWNYSS